MSILEDDTFQQLFTVNDELDGQRIKVIDDPYLRKSQMRHFIIYDILPAAFTAFAVVFAFWVPPSITDITLFLVFWVATGLGISIGYHRLFSHQSYQAIQFLRALLGICGSMAGQGGIISWVAMHRRHHELGDREGDLHSPNLGGSGWKGAIKGFLHAHFTWMAAHPYPNVVHYVPDLLKDKTTIWISRHYYKIALAGFVAPAIIGGLVSWSWLGAFTGFLWGGMVRMFVLEQGIWSLNSLCHMIGSRRFRTRDKSKNIGLLAPFIFGEAWHHNHHAFPGSAWFGLSWFRIDPGFWAIKFFEFLGMAKNVRVPTPEQQKKRLEV